jgi:hypothetical protein
MYYEVRAILWKWSPSIVLNHTPVQHGSSVSNSDGQSAARLNQNTHQLEPTYVKPLPARCLLRRPRHRVQQACLRRPRPWSA